ncbi:MAG: GNAT family N-acetyltransferase [Candidatus Binataceae bacterium]|nr:GNAT family N-acetyltransferase [Candidatus Binataceae bacterium]
MAIGAKKIRRRRAPGAIAIEQTADLARVAALLEAAAMSTAGVTAPGGCFLIAYDGDEPAGAIGIESRVDAALMRSLIVVERLRGRGIGAALIAAARTAAHTRGARRLYAIAPDDRARNYLARFGFAPVAQEELVETLAGTFTVESLSTNPDAIADPQNPANEPAAGSGYPILAMMADLSNDGVIMR